MRSNGLAALIDDARLSGLQVLVAAFCFLIAMLDGFDTQAIGFVAPVMAQAWHVPVTDFGPIFAIGLFGGLIGALVFGRVADRYGRKLTLIVTLVLIALGSLAATQATSPLFLTVCRFGAGLGLGGAMPSIIALTAEYAPRRLRGTLVTAMFCGFPIGAVLGAVLSARLMPQFGWPSVFLAGGLAPVLLLPVVWLLLPESMAWLAERGDLAKLEAILKRMARAPVGALTLEAPPAKVVSILGLFKGGMFAATLMLWVTFFLSLLVTYLLVSWVPTIAVKAGQTPAMGAIAAAVLNLGGVAGSLIIARIGDRVGAFKAVGGAFLIGAVVLYAVGVREGSPLGVFGFALAAGLFCIGAQMGAVAIASNLYPLQLRATGIGSAMGVGRLGAIAGPLIGARLLGGADVAHRLTVSLSIICLVAGVAVVIVGLSSRAARARHA